MPLHEYQCTNCKHKFERIVTFSKADCQHCPICDRPAEKKISASNFSMGWRLSDESLWEEGVPDYFVKGHK